MRFIILLAGHVTVSYLLCFRLSCMLRASRLASHSLFSGWTGAAGEKGLVTLGYSLCKSSLYTGSPFSVLKNGDIN